MWLAELGGVFYSIKEKGFSKGDREYSRKAELEAKMAEDKRLEDERLAKEDERMIAVKKTAAKIKGTKTQGAVVRPQAVGRKFGRGGF